MKLARELSKGDQFKWFGHWRTVTMTEPINLPGVHHGIYVMTGTGTPIKMWTEQEIEVRTS